MSKNPRRIHCNFSKWLFAAALLLSMLSYGGLSLPVPVSPQISYALFAGNKTAKHSRHVTYACAALQHTGAVSQLVYNAVTISGLSRRLCKSIRVKLVNHSALFIPSTVSTLHNRNHLPASTEDPVLLG